MLDKKAIGTNIKTLRKKLGLSGEKFGQKVRITKSALSQIEAGSISPSLELLNRIVTEFGTSFNFLMGKTSNAGPEGTNHDLHESVIADQPNISFVSTVAHAGYVVSTDDHNIHLKGFPRFSIPGLPKGDYRAFEVDGSSMLTEIGTGFYPGDIVVTQFCERPEMVQDDQVYIIVLNSGSHNEIILMRCRYIKDKNGEAFIRCDSDNPDTQYHPIYLPLNVIKEIWEFKRKITSKVQGVKGITKRMDTMEDKIISLEKDDQPD